MSEHRCKSCGETGHNRRTCPSAAAEPAEETELGKPRGASAAIAAMVGDVGEATAFVGLFGRKCPVCGERGHKKRDCPKHLTQTRVVSAEPCEPTPTSLPPCADPACPDARFPHVHPPLTAAQEREGVSVMTFLPPPPLVPSTCAWCVAAAQGCPMHGVRAPGASDQRERAELLTINAELAKELREGREALGDWMEAGTLKAAVEELRGALDGAYEQAADPEADAAMDAELRLMRERLEEMRGALDGMRERLATAAADAHAVEEARRKLEAERAELLADLRHVRALARGWRAYTREAIASSQRAANESARLVAERMIAEKRAAETPEPVWFTPPPEPFIILGLAPSAPEDTVAGTAPATPRAAVFYDAPDAAPIVRPAPPPPPPVIEGETAAVQRAVLAHFGLSVDLGARGRDKETSLARHVAMWLCRHRLGMAFKAIGYAFGGRSHTHVREAVHQLDVRALSDEVLRAHLDDLSSQIPDVRPPPPAPETLSRDVLRSRRPRAVRPSTVNVERIPRQKLAVDRARMPDANVRHLPMTRADCIDGPRPCPYVSCSHHLLLDVNPSGNLKLNFPDLVTDDDVRLEEMPATCALDLAGTGGVTLDLAGRALNVTRERIRQIEGRLIKKPSVRRALRDFAEDGRRRPVRNVDADEDEQADGVSEADADDDDEAEAIAS